MAPGRFHRLPASYTSANAQESIRKFHQSTSPAHIQLYQFVVWAPFNSRMICHLTLWISIIKNISRIGVRRPTPRYTSEFTGYQLPHLRSLVWHDIPQDTLSTVDMGPPPQRHLEDHQSTQHRPFFIRIGVLPTMNSIIKKVFITPTQIANTIHRR